MIRLVFNRLGVVWEIHGDDLFVPPDQKLVIESDLGGAIPEISVMPWPAFPTDLMSIAIVIATNQRVQFYFTIGCIQAVCSSSINSYRWVPTLSYVIHIDASFRDLPIVHEKMESPDIRAGMALVISALSADGISTIRNIGQIDRGYELVDYKLRTLEPEFKEK